MSPATGKRYPLTLICAVWRVARSSVYAGQAPEKAGPQPAQKRGPKTALSDAELVEEIRSVLKDSRFLGEGHKKVTARLRHKGTRVGRNRVLRLMREHRLLAPGAAAPRAWGSHAQRHHPYRAARPDVGHGCDAVLD